MAKKTAKVAIPVSKTNVNRLRYQTHTLRRILKLEGKPIKDGCVVNPITGDPVNLSMIELVPKKKQILVAVK